MKNKQPQQGIVLLISLMIISGVLATAVVVAGVILQDIQQSRLLDNAIQAYYLAESAAERGLYQTRKREAIKAQDCATVQQDSFCNESTGLCEDTGIACITTTPGAVFPASVSGGDWSVSVVNESETKFPLHPGDSFQIDLFSPFEAADSQSSGIESLVIGSEAIPAFSLYGQLTNLTVLVNPDSLCMPEPKITVSQGFIAGSNFSKTITGLSGVDINAGCSYVLRISSQLSNPPDNFDMFTLKVYDSEDPNFGTQLLIPSRLLISAEGEFKEATQRVKVRTPIRPPLSGLYDFVLFSEEEIVK